MLGKSFFSPPPLLPPPPTPRRKRHGPRFKKTPPILPVPVQAIITSPRPAERTQLHACMVFPPPLTWSLRSSRQSGQPPPRPAPPLSHASVESGRVESGRVESRQARQDRAGHSPSRVPCQQLYFPCETTQHPPACLLACVQALRRSE
jgi:hypothetical protein